MKERILSELKAELETTRANHHAEEKRRADEAARLDARIGELLSHRVNLFRQRMNAAFANPTNALEISERLKGEMRDISREIRERLVGAGLPEDYLQPIYDCGTCHDSGYVGDNIHTMCECMKGKLYGRLSVQAGTGINVNENFSTWRAAVFSDELVDADGEYSQRALMTKIRNNCEKYADAFPNTKERNILIIGRAGLGKTFLLNCIGQRVMERGFMPLKRTAYSIMSALRDAYFDRGDGEQLDLIFNTPLLIIDDLGIEPMLENVTIPQLFNLFNERRERNLSTLVSTNLTYNQIMARYSERLSSRLLDKTNTILMQCLGNDIRLNMR